jgi:hypothetical protein
MPSVTYAALKEIYKTYEWDASIGPFGGFVYVKHNNEIENKPIQLNNISAINKCNENITYSSKENISGLNNTTVELDNIPKGSLFGWDHINNVWVYYINDIPTFYSNYINN